MFSSNPFPELPLSPNVFITPNLLFDAEKDCACFNYYRSNTNPFTSDACFFHSPPIMDSVSTFKQDFVTHQHPKFSEGPVLQSCEDHNVVDAVISCSKCTNKPVKTKKDLRSKICTSRGPRDRRVRMSIEISRKFFCLHDLLGFNKASKTLDWLFTKSKKAIKELVEETSNRSTSVINDESSVKFLESIKGDSDEDKGKKKIKSLVKCVDDKKKKMTGKSVVGFQENLARDQARVMARARARERTREKMTTKMLNDEQKMLVPDEFDCQIEF